MKSKEARVVFSDGTSDIFDHVNMKDGYVFIRHESGDKRLHQKVPLHAIKKVTRVYDTSETPSVNVTAERGMGK